MLALRHGYSENAVIHRVQTPDGVEFYSIVFLLVVFI